MPETLSDRMSSSLATAEAIEVHGARVHNLKDVDVDIPRDRLVVLTGVSGSGKSSLAFDTLYAEGQRRYIESLSSFVRQFLDQLERPDVDFIEGLPPTVSIDQKSGAANPRSTVGTLTEVHDYLRVLYARAGVPYCPTCGEAIRRQSPEQIAATVLAMREGRKVLILAPLVRGRKGQHAEAFQTVRRAGLLRARVDGEIVEIARDDPKLTKTKMHRIEAVVDRLVVREGIRPRLAESIDLALKLGDGSLLLSAQTDEGWDDLTLSIHFACPNCGTGLEELEPRTFSFNSPYGACKKCDGLGGVSIFDPELVVPDPSLSLEQGAVAPWVDPECPPGVDLAQEPWVSAFLKKSKVKTSTPLASWPKKTLDRFIDGGETDADGVIPALERAFTKARKERVKAQLSVYRSNLPCPSCHGARLRPEACRVQFAGRTLPEVLGLPVKRAVLVFQGLHDEGVGDPVRQPLLSEIASRLAYLNDVGLGYLTLSRAADSLSGGELQRVRLATQIGSGLTGVCYVLDEPTAGLHAADTLRLLACLFGLRDAGNSVLVVEHDETMIRAADWVVDLGPGAGPDGGRIVAAGPPAALEEFGPSPTAAYLHRAAPLLPPRGRLERTPGWITVEGARANNLQNVSASIPLGTLTCVSGVSGSGKSTLVHDILTLAVRRRLERRGPRPGECDRVDGLELIDKLIVVDQTPIGRGPRSTPATFTGVYDEIRRVYARTREAKLRGYGPNRFSFNVKGGRCETCDGQGVRRVEMNFLPDLYVRCEACEGLRFNRQTLEVRFKGRSIGEVLTLRVDESRTMFEALPRVLRGLEALHEVGLGYITLGQASTTLSGGEAQRVKFAAELARPGTGRTLYVLDEPTTGLHFADVERLLGILQTLVDRGNTVLVIEHNVDVLADADWIVDLGPGGGEEGGRLMGMGTPEAIASDPESLTGRFLRLVPGRG